MVHADDVRASIKVCMFDQYGTVVDMQTGLTEATAPFLAAKGWQGDPNSFVTWWRRTHFENSMIDALLGREHTSYREIGHRSIAFVLERAGISYTLDEVHDLVAHIERLRPFPEVPEALARLQTRYPLVVLSNGGRVEDWRAGWGRSISTLPRFQPPPRRTQHADFPHCAPHLLHVEAYWTYPAEATFGRSRRTR